MNETNDAPITQQPLSVKLRPRNDLVIFEILPVDKLKNLYMTANSEEGRRLTVIAVGPKVEDLKPGDNVRVQGKMGVTYAPVPGHPTLFIIPQEHVLLVIEPLPEPEQSPMEIACGGGVNVAGNNPSDTYEQIHD